jgi:hypothetical protein
MESLFLPKFRLEALSFLTYNIFSIPKPLISLLEWNPQ